jgi:CheY-like chemotaxis protein
VPGALPVRQVHVEVADTGIGMNEDTRRRCLEPFFTTKGERGTGLGLAMVYGIAKRHNARIDIDSLLNSGTTMRLSFTVPAATAVAQGPLMEQPIPSLQRILLIDDDPLVLNALRDTLEADGHTVTTASGGRQGIDTFRADRPPQEMFTVVITDLGMPYVGGREVASAIKESSPSTPIILLTGWGQRLVAEGEMPQHIDRMLSKPPTLDQLRAALTELTSTSRT